MRVFNSHLLASSSLIPPSSLITPSFIFPPSSDLFPKSQPTSTTSTATPDVQIETHRHGRGQCHRRFESRLSDRSSGCGSVGCCGGDLASHSLLHVRIHCREPPSTAEYHGVLRVPPAPPSTAEYVDYIKCGQVSPSTPGMPRAHHANFQQCSNAMPAVSSR